MRTSPMKRLFMIPMASNPQAPAPLSAWLRCHDLAGRTRLLPALPVDGPVLRLLACDAGPGRAMAHVMIVVATLCFACPSPSPASETDPGRGLPAQDTLPVSRADPSGPVEDGPLEGGPYGVGPHGVGDEQTADMSDAVLTRAAEPPGLASGGFSRRSSHSSASLALLEAAILRMESEIAELGRLADWQARLLDAARTDPDGARRQRRARSSCLKTPLAAFCDRLNGMYRDHGGRPAGDDGGGITAGKDGP